MKFFKKVIRVRNQKREGVFVQVTNSKVVFYIHLQLIKDNILSVVILLHIEEINVITVFVRLLLWKTIKNRH
ncbi:entericidin B [Salmonella enterica subsp. enterica]|nr:entericidin B [Salmonella enterica subsp. enterica]